MIDQEVQLTSDVTNQYPGFHGTPSFIINGKLRRGIARAGKRSNLSYRPR